MNEQQKNEPEIKSPFGFLTGKTENKIPESKPVGIFTNPLFGSNKIVNSNEGLPIP